MQNLLKILLRYGNFLVFICLEVAAFLLFSLNNAYPRSSVFSTANQLVAWQHEQVNEIKSYFGLKELNEHLARENAQLHNLLSALQEADSDSLSQQTQAYTHASISYLPAKVVQITTTDKNNYLTINRGEKDSVQRGQGVINADGVVGIVQTVGKNYSVVLPIINMHTHVSCRFAKNDYIAVLQWDGKDSRFAQLTDVTSHLLINPGDTIITSGLSPVFPEGIPVGIVENCFLEKGDSYYNIRVRLHTNFKRLKYVNVVCNANQNEIEQLTHELE